MSYAKRCDIDGCIAVADYSVTLLEDSAKIRSDPFGFSTYPSVDVCVGHAEGKSLSELGQIARSRA